MYKTAFLMIVLTLIFMYVGQLVGGAEGIKMAFLAACGMNFFSYFFSDKLVLKQYNAKEATSQSAPELYQIVKRLSEKANLPMPKVYVIAENVPNAFATGRNPDNAAVAATQGLLDLMSPQEIEGVLAHELSHVKHRDILIGSVAATFAGAIAMLANTAQRSQNSQNQRTGILAAVLMPIAAMIVQMAISRTREYKADEGAAYLTGHPEWLMSALSKLENYSKNYQMARATSQTAHMFIINPFNGIPSGLTRLFSTHPSTKDRLNALENIRQQLL